MHIFLVGPPRCGLTAIADLLSSCKGIFTCRFTQLVTECESLLYSQYAMLYYRNGKGMYGLPNPWKRVAVRNEQYMSSLLSLIEREATEQGWNGSDHIVIPIRHLIPLFPSVHHLRGSEVAWCCIRRDAAAVEASCVATKWMPRLPEGSWVRYTEQTLHVMNSIRTTAPVSFDIHSDAVFAGDDRQIKAVVSALGCTFSGQKIGGACANKPS